MEYLNEFRPDLVTDEYSFARKVFTDDKTDKKIHKHLEDEEDEITDQDLENIKTEMTPATDEEEKEEGKKQGFTEEELDV